MASKRNKKRKPKSSVDLALSTGSPVAVAALTRGGAGKHGGSDETRNRRDRRGARQSCRNWQADH